MSLALHPALHAARLHAIAAALDADAAPAVLHLYTGPQPGPGAPVTDQGQVASIVLSQPAATVDEEAGTLAFSPSPPALAIADGAVAWGRVVDGAGVWVLDADAGALGSGAALILDAVNFYAGGYVSLLAGTLTEA